MLLTGFRRMETLALQRDWVDMEAGCVRFPQTKTSAQVRPIGREPLQLIAKQPTVNDSPFVFPGEAGNEHFVGIARVLKRLSAVAKLEPVTPHVLRHTFASDLGFSELTVAALLGHASRGVTQRYVHLDKAVQLAAEEVCRTIDEMLVQRPDATGYCRSGHTAFGFRNRDADIPNDSSLAAVELTASEAYTRTS